MKIFIRYVRTTYDYFVTIPDRFYPFAEEIEGEKVRWQAAYNKALERIQEKNGHGHYGPKLIAYRGFFHVLGAILFIFFSVLVSRELVGNEGAMYLLFAFAAAAILYQETYVQKRTHGQKLFHSFMDWFSWVVPMVIYVWAQAYEVSLSQVLHELVEILT